MKSITHNKPVGPKQPVETIVQVIETKQDEN